MNDKTRLQNAKFPRIVGDLMHSNQFLKMFSIYALTLTVVTAVALIFAVTRDPIVLTLNTRAETVPQGEIPKAEDQVKEAVKAYLHMRYKWKPENVTAKLKASEVFILPMTLRAFQESVSKVARFSTEKMVTQTVYPEEMKVNLEDRTVRIEGDRVTSIQGMKAAGDLKLEISFEAGPRTKGNPWGFYVMKEKEE